MKAEKMKVMKTANIKTLTIFLLIFLCASRPLAALGAVNLRDMDFERVHPEVRIKDVVDLEGARSNQLSGIGVVVGLSGTGDKSPMAMQMMKNMLQQ
ncbi:MAG: flagellar basal body P-ring protein FlgI, partial [Synergistaceae bacterium]|nr:flagellar basal body P-ring protein FlgI [Synergistaceae bacterium]